jgi:hypothetical protein
MVNLSLNIKRFYTDANGTVIDKTTAPIAMQKKMPFYLFNKFDRDSGYLIGQTVKPSLPGLFYLFTYVVGVGYNFLDFQFGNTIKQQLRNGDLVLVYADDPILMTTFCLIVIHSDYVGYGGFLENMKNKNMKVSSIQYFTNNDKNWLEVFNITSVDNFGLYKDNTLQPIAYRDPYVFQADMIQIDYDMTFDDKTGLESYMLFDTDSIELNFLVDSLDFSTLQNNSNSGNNGNTNSSARLLQIA